MKFRELKANQFFRFKSRVHDGEIRKKISRHTYAWVYPDGSLVGRWKATGESDVELIPES